MNTIVINLFGEPGAGKSTAAMDITARLKRKGINAEYVSEFAKDKVYENNGEVFKHQEYLFGKQSFKMGRVRDKVQVMVVDSPLILCIVYNNDETLGEVLIGQFAMYLIHIQIEITFSQENIHTRMKEDFRTKKKR